MSDTRINKKGKTICSFSGTAVNRRVVFVPTEGAFSELALFLRKMTTKIQKTK